MSRTAPCYPNHYQRFTARSPCFSFSQASNCYTYFKKKPYLENIPKNYRPVSNLPYLGKLLEKAALEQLHHHFEINNIHEPFQSAYKPMHSTETALIRIMNDMLIDLDNRKVIFLALLDLSAAFDTVDHTILVNRIENSQGVGGNALEWIRSYLTGRSQRVSAHGAISETVSLECGLPKGSLFGPEMYNKYTEPLGKLILLLLIIYHKSISNWMCANKLKLNESKTEFLVIGSKANLSKVKNKHISVGGEVIQNLSAARNLGVLIDEQLSLHNHTHQVAKICRFHIHSIWKIRDYLSEATTKSIVHSVIISRLDYCNALYINRPVKLRDVFQKIMNEAARLITRTSRYDHITKTIIYLHWLPIKERIQFKVLVRLLRHFITKPRHTSVNFSSNKSPFAPFVLRQSVCYTNLLSISKLLDTVRSGLQLHEYGISSPIELDRWTTLPHSRENSKLLCLKVHMLVTYEFLVFVKFRCHFSFLQFFCHRVSGIYSVTY